jgi:hypothetical protein
LTTSSAIDSPERAVSSGVAINQAAVAQGDGAPPTAPNTSREQSAIKRFILFRAPLQIPSCSVPEISFEARLEMFLHTLVADHTDLLAAFKIQESNVAQCLASDPNVL